MRDGLHVELQQVERDMESMSPKTSTYQKLAKKRDELRAKLGI